MPERPPKPSKAESQSIKEATREADPTTFTPVPLDRTPKTGSIIHGGREFIRVQSGGSEYYELNKAEKNEAHTELLISRLLKGIVNVSDAVPHKTKPKFFSKIMELGRVRDQSITEEGDVDITLLIALFSDRDHIGPDHNLAKQDKAIVFYDFGRAYDDFFRLDRMPHEEPVLKRLSDEALALFIEKLESVRERAGGPEGRAFIESALGGISMPEAFDMSYVEEGMDDPIGLFQNILLARIDQYSQKAANLLEERRKSV